MAQSGEFSDQSSSEIVDITSGIQDNEKLAEDSLQQELHHESATFVPSIEDSDGDSKGFSQGQIENDLAAETNKLAPVATSAEVDEVSSPVDAPAGSADSGSPSIFSEDEEGNRKIQIDTKAPFESVKAAVSKFGGIVDWRAHKVHTVEKSKVVEQELDKVQEEIPLYREHAEIAEQSKNQMVKDLEGIKKVIEELKQKLEIAETEERQAKQDCQLVQLRVDKVEQEISQETSVAAKTELEVAKARYTAAVTDLKAIKDELEGLQKEYDSLLAETKVYEKKTEEAISASKGMEKTLEELKAELITLKESLEYERAAHLKNGEKRTAVIMAKEQEILNCDNDLKQAEEDLEKLNKQIDSAKDLKSKLDKASSLVEELKAELVAYMESKVNQEKNGDKTDAGMHEEVAGTYEELEELKLSIEKATDEVNCLKLAAMSLKTELEQEEAELANLKQREGIDSATVSSLEAELARVKSEITALQAEEKEASEKMEKLHLASREAVEAKAAATLAHEELKKAEEEAKQAKSAVNTIESQLLEAKKEIEAAQATHKLAQDAIKALKETELAQTFNDEESDDGVELSLEQYYELIRCADEAKEQANMKVTTALSMVDVERESESKSLKQLEEVNREVEERREAVRIALRKAEKAKEAKLGVEQELRQWRAEHELRRKAAELAQVSVNSPRKNNIEDVQGLKGVDPSMGQGLRIEKVVDVSSPLVAYGQGLGLKTLEQLAGSTPKADRASPKADGISPKAEGPSPKADGESPKATLGQSNTVKKKKRSFFPRFFMFFTRRRSKQS